MSTAVNSGSFGGELETARARLTKLCGMFGSHHDGERASAAAMADRLVRDLGLTWPEIINPHHQHWREPETIAEQIDTALAHAEALSEWERGFVCSVNGCQRLSPKQRNVLDGIIAKLRAVTRAAP
jgi:hypothetical protein